MEERKSFHTLFARVIALIFLPKVLVRRVGFRSGSGLCWWRLAKRAGRGPRREGEGKGVTGRRRQMGKQRSWAHVQMIGRAGVSVWGRWAG